ncbi:hypothetical protein [Frigoriglobus tundricola]|uniref:Apea-like HEPN domain-containing protein n=1 Tax=Frigoriglobus tundricola TaxID=2774151 RepID=A0A6M5Z3Q5_9BACT|nr:hypothetical protein [Frigoriglobus tundricola]QJX01060.1 hypothetical protein FTUN_8699 [Frigoriglobus tundricola]
MPTVKDNELVLAIRMRELCRPPSAWNRALWSVSAQTALREVLEAAKVRRDGILSDASLTNLQHTTAVLLGKDPGLGDAVARKHLQTALQNGKSVITPGSLSAATIDQVVQDLDSQYLPRWATAIDAGVADAILEQCARSVVSHLLNRGHSRQCVADRISDAVLKPVSTITKASDLIRDLQTLASQPSTEYEAVFPVSSAPDSNKTKSPGWMPGATLVGWMKTNAIPDFAANERASGAVTFKVAAPDRPAAEHTAAARFAVIRDRAMLSVRQPIASLGYFWLSGSPQKASIEPQSRGVEVASIGRQDKIYSTDDSIPNIERSIALLAELDHGPSSAAVTSGWAAVESLAMGPAEDGDRIETAVRIAALVTASFVRAELTTLAYSYAKSNKDALTGEIKSAANNKERCEKIMQRLQTPPLPTFGRVEDAAGAKRMVQLLNDPVTTLKRINQYIECALRRLYRLRNLVAHGARTDFIALEAGVRAAAPLVGAAFDRIYHASTSQALNPVELIARAQLRIAMLDAAQVAGLLNLLD